MMRSLWSGVSGLKTHQIGMDVEGNNISNVNTYGFKYSRVNYATLFSQTMKIATRPQGDLGGQNAMQVGLGVLPNSTMRIHTQGSLSTTEKNTDLAIQGNGFFLVSDDGGKNKYMTRDGSFFQDAAGNFVNTSGYVVQGWNRDSATGLIDTSKPAENIYWDPGMKIPANPSSNISLSATLNSSVSKIDTNASRFIYSLDSTSGYNNKTGVTANENDKGTNQFYTTSKNAMDLTEKGVDMSAVFNDSGTGLNLRDGQGFWMSFKDSEFSTNSGLLDQNGAVIADQVFDINTQANQPDVTFWGAKDQPVTLDITLNGQRIQNNTITSLDQAIEYINTFTSADGTRDGTGVRAVKNDAGTGIDFVNTNKDGQLDTNKNINLVVNGENEAGEAVDALWDAQNGTFTFTKRSVANSTQRNDAAGNMLAPAGQSRWIRPATDGQNPPTLTIKNSVQVITAHKYVYDSNGANVPPMFNPDGGATYIAADPNLNGANPNGPDRTWWPNTDQGTASYNYYMAMNGNLLSTAERSFTTTEDLRELLQRDARYGVDYDGSGLWEGADINEKVQVTVNEKGQYNVTNRNENTTISALGTDGAGNPIYPPGITAAANSVAAKNMSFQNSSYRDDTNLVSSNDALSNLFAGWQGVLNTGNSFKNTESLRMSSFGTSLQVFDSLGTEHMIQVEWSKQGTTVDGGNEWNMIIRVSEPATINTGGVGPNNIIVGSVRFGNDGSLLSYDPRTINFSPNNGAASNQQITLNLGATGEFSGLVSNENSSGMSEQATDGYKAGVLKKGNEGVRIDQRGNILGVFDNGVSMYLATVAVGSVTNDSGLEDIGGNMFRLSSNSGTLTIGTSGTGGRGMTSSGALEMSNVDLSQALTNLIIIQRGYQANSKTITTSDQMLNTLLQLKQ